MPPPPLQRDGCRASCLRRACVMLQRREDNKPPPPHTPPPPQGWGMKEGRGGQRPPLPRTKRQDGEAAGRGCGTDHTTVPEGSTRRASPSGGGTGGANAEWEGRRRGPRGVPHSPTEGQVPRHVPAPCLRRAYAGGRTARAPPPPHPQLPHPPRKGARTVRGRRGDMGDDGNGMRTPPPRTPRQGAVERGCGTNHTTVPKGSTRRASPNGGTTGGATAGKVG